MLYHPDDDNLHAVAYADIDDDDGNPITPVQFHPYADGVFDLELEDYNDFAGMEDDICQHFEDVYEDDRCGGFQSIILGGVDVDEDSECDLEAL